MYKSIKFGNNTLEFFLYIDIDQNLIFLNYCLKLINYVQ